MTPIAVAISGLHRGDNPQPGAAVAAALRRRFSDLRIIGLSYDPFESALYDTRGSHPEAAYLLPYPGAGADAVLERLDQILRCEKFDLLIPCLDSEIDNFIAIFPELRKRGIRCMLPAKKALDERSKVHLPALCSRLKIDTPRTESASDPETLAQHAEAIGYPVYVKGRFYDAHLVTSKAQLYEAFEEISGLWGTPILVQEPMAGEEYDIVGLGDGKGGLFGSCTIRKMMRTSAGKGFAGIAIRDPALESLTRRIIAALRWNGPFELEFIKMPGRPHALFEMNPRFPAWVDFPAQISCNLPACLVENMLGMPLTPLEDCPPGRIFIRHSIDLVTDIAEIAKMTITGQRGAPSAVARPALEVIE